MNRLLLLSPFPARPLSSGAAVRIHHLAQSLAGGHQLWVSFRGRCGDSRFAGEIPASKNRWRAIFGPLHLLRAWLAVRRHRIQVIVASSLLVGLHGALLKLFSGRPLWLDQHNVEWRCLRLYGSPMWPMVYILERLICRQADLLTCVSEQDRNYLIRDFKLDPERVLVAPNGFDPDIYHPKVQPSSSPSPDPSRRRILFFGVLTYSPNTEAVRILAEDLAPLCPDSVDLLVAGVGHERLAQIYPNLTFLGYVEKLPELIRACDAVIVPLASGGGTRLKILEAVACGRPVLSTVVGAEGLDREILGKSVSLVESSWQMRDLILSLPHRHQVPPNPRFLETHSWPRIWARVFQSIFSGSNPLFPGGGESRTNQESPLSAT